MKLFLKKIFILGVFLILILGLTAFVQRNQVWKLTNSVSMDAKLCYGRQRNAVKLDVIAIGSSMTLNNLNSEKVLEALSDDMSYFNYGAWGLQMTDTGVILESLLQTSEPKSVIIVSNIVDFFGNGESMYAGIKLRNYIKGHIWNDMVLSVEYAFPHNIETIESYEFYRERIHDYSSLNFDFWGGVPLEVYGENISSDRWNIVLEKDSVKEEEYVALEELCELTADKGINLYFVQSPFRLHYLSGIGEEEMKAHLERCRQILERYGQFYYSAVDFEKYQDDLFADYIHLNKEGSQNFTEEFMEYYKICETAGDK